MEWFVNKRNMTLEGKITGDKMRCFKHCAMAFRPRKFSHNFVNHSREDDDVCVYWRRDNVKSMFALLNSQYGVSSERSIYLWWEMRGMHHNRWIEIFILTRAISLVYFLVFLQEAILRSGIPLWRRRKSGFLIQL